MSGTDYTGEILCEKFNCRTTKGKNLYAVQAPPTPPTAIERAIAKRGCGDGGRIGRGRGRLGEGVAVTDPFVFGSTVSICDRRERERKRERERERRLDAFAPHSHSEDIMGEMWSRRLVLYTAEAASARARWPIAIGGKVSQIF